MWLVDAAGRTSTRPLVRLTILLVLLAGIGDSLGQTPAGLPTRLQQLLENGQWHEVIRVVNGLPKRPPNIEYIYGTALAKLGRWEDAYNAFFAGYRMRPQDGRFALELAGVQFKRKRYADATKWLHRALKQNPTDAYANDFLGTIYYLEGNLDASLKHWNYVGKPKISKVGLDPEPLLDAILLDRAFAVAPASILKADELHATETRLRGLGVFSSMNFQLAAQSDDEFTLVAHAVETNGFGPTKLQGAVSFLRGVFQQTVYPEYFNLHHSAVNLESTIRWDSEKRRATGTISGPFRHDAKWRYRFHADLRNENWSFRAPSAASPELGALNLRREAIAAGITSFASGDFGWSTGVELSRRNFRDVVPGPATARGSLLQGYQLKHRADFNYTFLRAPENRLTTSASLSTELARIWSQPSRSFMKLQTGISAHWFPRSRGDDYETSASIRVGKAFGSTPVDELFVLGIDRDSDVWLRGHPATYRGRKGSGPIGSSYLLSNVDFSKNLYTNGILSLKVGSFVDVGKMLGYPLNTTSQQWLCDSGLQSKIKVLGVGLIFVYGKDFRSGRNSFYATTQR